MQTSREELNKDQVKLRVEVPEAALGAAIDAAYRRWAKEIKVPGFRKGKIPRQIIDSRVGPEVIREEALRDALPDLYRDALKAEGVEAIAAPEIEVVSFETGNPLVFEATVDVRPDVVVPDLSSITIDAPDASVTEKDVDEQLERLRDRFAELEPIGREARRGDFVLMDLKGHKHEELVEGASAPDFLYEVGSRTGPAKLDEELEGSRPGSILKFNDTLPDGATDEISFTVLVKEVKTKKLPPLDDAFAKTVGELDSLDALKDDIRVRLAEVKKRWATEEVRRSALDAIVAASQLDPPGKLVDTEVEHRWHHFEDDLSGAGVSLDEYARRMNLTELEMRRDMRAEAHSGVMAELLLEQVAREQKLEVTEEDFGRQVALIAMQAGRDPKEVAEQLVQGGRLGAIAADIMRRKALDFVVQSINIAGGVVEEEPEETASEDPVDPEPSPTQ